MYDAALSSLIEATAADGAAMLLFDDDGLICFRASREFSREYQTAVTRHRAGREEAAKHSRLSRLIFCSTKVSLGTDKRSCASLWFRSIDGAPNTIDGYAAMHMIQKGQVRWLAKGDVIGQVGFINRLFIPA